MKVLEAFGLSSVFAGSVALINGVFFHEALVGIGTFAFFFPGCLFAIYGAAVAEKD